MSSVSTFQIRTEPLTDPDRTKLEFEVTAMAVIGLQWAFALDFVFKFSLSMMKSCNEKEDYFSLSLFTG